MTLRLNDDDDDRMLTERARTERRSKQEIAQEAIHLYLTDRARIFSQALDTAMEDNQEVLRLLSDR